MRRILRFAFSVVLVVLAGAGLAGAQESNFRTDAWARITAEDEAGVEALATEFKAFMREARYDLLTVAESIRQARAQGFRPIEEYDRLKPGDRVIFNNRDRAAIFAVVGKRPMTDGATLVAAHLDAVRIELKANPLYEKEGFALFQTSYHGGLKNYQWVGIPLALVGRVSKKDGSNVDIRFGLEGEPYLVIPDLAPHVDLDLRDRTQRDVFKGEELDPIVASRAAADGSVVGTVTAFLKKEYGIGPEDFVSADLALVPALPPADIGFDRSLIAAYGLDDILSSYIGLRALFDIKAPARTAMVYMSGNEEVGSRNVTGARSTFLEDVVLDLLEKESGQTATLRQHRKAVSEIHVLSADTTTGVHPTFPQVQEKLNAARIGGGVVVKVYGRGNNPTSEVMAKVRALLDGNKIPWQTHTYKVDVGGGGTLGTFLSDDGMDVVDVGVGILSMHAPWNFVSKADL